MTGPGGIAVRFLGALVLVCAGVLAQPARSAGSETTEGELALEFARAAAECFSRRDTHYPVFSGCMDWHSAVHAAWAIVQYERMTGDARFREVLLGRLTREGVQREREFLLENPRFELPYGRAWLLHLRIELSDLTGDDRLDGAAEAAARTLHEYVREAPDGFGSSAYANSTWALLALLRYEGHRHSSPAVAELVTIARGALHHGANACVRPRSPQRSAFFDACSLLLWLAARVLDDGELRAWLAANLPVEALPVPVTPSSAHSFGLNFSRSWGYRAVSRSAAGAPYREAYEAHFERGLADFRSNQRDYGRVGHWVAQFGLLALTGFTRLPGADPVRFR